MAKPTIKGGELLMYAKSISSERELPYAEVLDIFADALAQSLRRSADDLRKADFRVHIDADSGKHTAFRRWHVLDDDTPVETPERELTLAEARDKSASSEVNAGDIVEEPMGAVEFNRRVSMLSAKQYLNARLRDAERRRLMNSLLQKNEMLVSGQIMRVLRDRGDAIVEIMRVDCFLPKSEMIPRETLKTGDRVQALIKEMVNEGRGQQIVLTRTAPEFLVHLFQRVVPEIEKGVLEIVGALRAPGNRAKIAVRSDDPRIDPVGACVGMRGSRVQAVTNELNGERIDIIHWHEDDATYVLRALAPAEVSKINVDRERRRMDVLVEPESMAQAIGKNGANVRLASELTGWELILRTPDEYEKESEDMLAKKSENLAATLDLDAELARILCEEGFESPEHVAYAEAGELAEIEGFDEEVAGSIQQRAKEAVEKREAVLREKLLTIDKRLSELPDMDDQLLYDLAGEDILTLEDFADLSVDDLLEVVQIPSKRAAALIVGARRICENEAAEEEGGGAADER